MKRCWRVVLTNGKACSMINDEKVNRIKALAIAMQRFGDRVERVE